MHGLMMTVCDEPRTMINPVISIQCIKLEGKKEGSKGNSSGASLSSFQPLSFLPSAHLQSFIP